MGRRWTMVSSGPDTSHHPRRETVDAAKYVQQNVDAHSAVLGKRTRPASFFRKRRCPVGGNFAITGTPRRQLLFHWDEYELNL